MKTDLKESKSFKFKELVKFFEVFSDETRLKILWILIEEGPVCVTRISELLSMSQPAVSWQLRILRNANLVETKREGKFIRYSISDKHVREIIDIALNHINEGGN
jgi:DNA-binding transcriptional ArsR family regulator